MSGQKGLALAAQKPMVWGRAMWKGAMLVAQKQKTSERVKPISRAV